MWEGVCQDGKPLVLLMIGSISNEIEGTISLGNVNFGNSAGNRTGTCTATDPASRDHSMPIKNALVDGQKLTFESARGLKFEMVLTSGDSAALRFLSTPMEDAAFDIHKKSP